MRRWLPVWKWAWVEKLYENWWRTVSYHDASWCFPTALFFRVSYIYKASLKTSLVATMTTNHYPCSGVHVAKSEMMPGHSVSTLCFERKKYTEYLAFQRLSGGPEAILGHWHCHLSIHDFGYICARRVGLPLKANSQTVSSRECSRCIIL